MTSLCFFGRGHVLRMKYMATRRVNENEVHGQGAERLGVARGHAGDQFGVRWRFDCGVGHSIHSLYTRERVWQIARPDEKAMTGWEILETLKFCKWTHSGVETEPLINFSDST